MHMRTPLRRLLQITGACWQHPSDNTCLTFDVRRGFRQHKNNRTHHDRLAQLHANWSLFIADLEDAYVAWKAKASENFSAYPSDTFPSGIPSDVPPSDASSDMSHPVSPETSATSPSSYDFEIATIDIYTLCHTHTIHRTFEMKMVVALMNHGLLSNVPLLPSMALSLNMLELYRKLQLQKPLFSGEAFAKVICDLYMVV